VGWPALRVGRWSVGGKSNKAWSLPETSDDCLCGLHGLLCAAGGHCDRPAWMGGGKRALYSCSRRGNVLWAQCGANEVRPAGVGWVLKESACAGCSRGEVG